MKVFVDVGNFFICLERKVCNLMVKNKMEKVNVYTYVIIISAGIFLRAAISLHPYSGFKSPPMFGDFEVKSGKI